MGGVKKHRFWKRGGTCSEGVQLNGIFLAGSGRAKDEPPDIEDPDAGYAGQAFTEMTEDESVEYWD